MQDTSSGPPLDYWINQGKDLIEASWPWPFLRRRGTIVTVAPVTAGDADVTNGSKNVSSERQHFMGSRSSWEEVQDRRRERLLRYRYPFFGYGSYPRAGLPRLYCY